MKASVKYKIIYRETMIKDARDKYFITQNDLDKNLDLFNCQNGTYNLRTGEFRPHRPQDLLSKVSNVVYDPEARSTRFEQFISDIMQGDEAKINYEYLGEATGSGGEVFPNVVTRTITDEEIERMQYVYCGLDWGFSVDPFAFIRLSYDRKTDTVYLLDELYQKNCSNAKIAELIKEKGYHISGKLHPGGVMYSPYAEQQTIFADAAEPKSIADLRGAGLKIYPCKKYPGSVIYGIRWLQNRKIVIDPKRTPHAWKEFTEYEYLTTKDGEFLADVPDENNHLIDSCRYALDRLINTRGVSA